MSKYSNNLSHEKFTLQDYKQICQKGSLENYIFDQLIARKVSIFVTIPFIWMGIRPNQATFLSLISLFSCFYFFISDKSINLLTGAFLLFFYYLLDHVDGELARYYSKMEPDVKKGLDGQYFDVLCHFFSGNIIIFFFGISAWRIFGYEWAVMLSFWVSVGINRFPERVANKIMIMLIANQPQTLGNKSVNQMLNILEMKKNQIEAVQAPITDIAKWIKIVKELLGFPGLLLLMIIAAVLDAILNHFTLYSFSINFRLLLVLFLFPLELLRLVLSSYKYFNLFKTVITDK